MSNTQHHSTDVVTDLQPGQGSSTRFQQALVPLVVIELPHLRGECDTARQLLEQARSQLQALLLERDAETGLRDAENRIRDMETRQANERLQRVENIVSALVSMIAEVPPYMLKMIQQDAPGALADHPMGSYSRGQPIVPNIPTPVSSQVGPKPRSHHAAR